MPAPRISCCVSARTCQICEMERCSSIAGSTLSAVAVVNRRCTPVLHEPQLHPLCTGTPRAEAPPRNPFRTWWGWSRGAGPRSGTTARRRCESRVRGRGLGHRRPAGCSRQQGGGPPVVVGGGVQPVRLPVDRSGRQVDCHQAMAGRLGGRRCRASAGARRYRRPARDRPVEASADHDLIPSCQRGEPLVRARQVEGIL
jgi:hypothetical protein